MKALNLGCGQDVRESTDEWEWTNLDIADIPGVDVVWDLDRYPWPFGDRELDAILADDVWEHVADPIAFMAEVHRILKPGGQVKVRTCQPNRDGFRDPTHRRWATAETLDYWVVGTYWHTKYGHYADGRTFRHVEPPREEGTNLVFLLERLPDELDEMRAMDGDDG